MSAADAVRRSTRVDVAAAMAALTGADRATAERGERDQGRRQAVLRAGPRGGAGRAGRSAGHGAPVRRARLAAAAARPARPVLDLDVEVDVSSGTYVRALARDLGAALGVGGHLTALRRTRVGPFGLDVARTLPDLEADFGYQPLAAAARAAFPARELTDRGCRRCASASSSRPTGSGETPVAGFDAGRRAGRAAARRRRLGPVAVRRTGLTSAAPQTVLPIGNGT